MYNTRWKALIEKVDIEVDARSIDSKGMYVKYVY